jgi:hypothetical protein
VVLAVVEGALESTRDHTALADLRQLMGLAERMDQAGFLPLSATDLTGPNATRVLQFCQMVDQAMSLVLTNSFANKNGLKATAGAGWYGHYFRMHGYGCQLSFNAPHWARYGHSPIWLRVANGLFRYPEGLYAPIASTLPSPGWLCEERDYSPGLWMPIRLSEGRDRDIVVDGMLAQILRIADVLATRPIQLAADVPQSVAPEVTGGIVGDI